MKLGLVEKIEEGKRVIDLNLSREEVELGSPWECKKFRWGERSMEKILQESNIFHICQGFDSDIYKVGDKALKVYCDSGSFFGGKKVSFETLQKYQILTAETKEILEKNPPEKFTKYGENGK